MGPNQKGDCTSGQESVHCSVFVWLWIPPRRAPVGDASDPQKTLDADERFGNVPPHCGLLRETMFWSKPSNAQQDFIKRNICFGSVCKNELAYMTAKTRLLHFKSQHPQTSKTGMLGMQSVSFGNTLKFAHFRKAPQHKLNRQVQFDFSTTCYHDGSACSCRGCEE